MTTNHTTAETWLRNAPAGVRSVTAGRRWVYTATETGFLATGPYDVDRIELANLEPDTYTLNYREGMQLDAQEAWDYLADGVGRRVKADWGQHLEPWAGVYRMREGVLEIQLGNNWEPSESATEGALYTIAPDEPAETILDSCKRIAEQVRDAPEWQKGGINLNPQHFETYRNDEPDDRAAATKAAEPDCCREARELVAELERDVAALVQERDRLDRWVGEQHGELSSWASKNADLEAKLAEAEEVNRALSQDYDEAGRSFERLSGAIAERDKLRAEVERLTKALASTVEHYDRMIGTNGKLITLPTDTTTPLDLAQRAVALMGGRVKDGWFHYRIHPHSSCGQLERAAMKGELFSDTWEDASWEAVMATQRRITLAPEPEPARRKLSFGEAVALAGEAHAPLTLATWTDNGGITFRLVRNGGGPGYAGAYVFRAADNKHVAVTPAMLAAEWEATD